MALSDVHPLAAAKHALVDVIADTDSDLDVFYGRVASQVARDRAVSVIGGTGTVSPTFLGSGRAALLEQWSVDVVCISAAMNHEPAHAEASALRLANTVIDAVADNPTLNGTAECAWSTDVAVTTDLDDEPFVASVSVSVAIMLHKA